MYERACRVYAAAVRTPPPHRELWFTLLFSCVIIIAMVSLTVWFFARSQSILTADVQERLRTNAALAAMQFSAADVGTIQSEEDRESDLFRILVERAEAVRSNIPSIEYVYILRRTEDPRLLSFVLENDMLASLEEQDVNGDGILQQEERVPGIGDRFALADAPAMEDAFTGPTADPSITSDVWGRWLSGYAPIRDADGRAVAILGLDMHADQFVALTSRIFSPVLLSFSLLAILLIMGSFFAYLFHRRMQLLQSIDAQRAAMVTVASHKLGGPIATLRWWTELLREETSPNKSQCKEAEKELSQAVERLSDVTKQLADSNRIDGSQKGLWQKLAAETAREIAATTVSVA